MAEDTVTLSRAEYDAMLARIEDLEATIAYDRATRADDGVRIPGEVVNAEMLEGLHPVAAWRRHRGMSRRDLAEHAGMDDAGINDIESGRSPGSVHAYKAISQALDAPLDALIPDAESGDG